MNSKFKNVSFVFLDRDGVINRKAPEDQYIARWEDFSFLPRSVEAIARLNTLGMRVIVVTNQRGIALGLYTEDDLRQLHRRMLEALRTAGATVDAIYFCPHDRDCCDCRKPAPGLFHAAFRDFPTATPANSLVIGDSLSDIEAGTKLGMRTIYVTGSDNTRKPGGEKAVELADASADSLDDAVQRYLTL